MPELRKRPKLDGIISWDTESTGLDLAHGARPFFVTVCHPCGNQDFWEWEVDPLTRKVVIPKADLRKIIKIIDGAERTVGQNGKFDVRGLGMACDDAGISWSFDWSKAEDTLISGHLLASAMQHDLTSMALHWLGKRGDIKHFEDALEVAVKRGLGIVRRDHKDWAIAKKGRPDMPSAKDRTWKYDGWVPKALDPNSKELEEYGNADSAVDLLLWMAHRQELEERGLWTIYRHRMEVAAVIPSMEAAGVTCSRKRLAQLRDENQSAKDAAEKAAKAIAAEHDYDLEVPKAGNNGSLKTFCFGAIGPKIISGGQTGVDQAALRAAQACDLETGGWAPKGFKTLAGPEPALKKVYGLRQHKSEAYEDRTYSNVEDAEATLQVYRDPTSPGERCTLRAVDKYRRPLHRIDLANRGNGTIDKAAEFVARFGVVNVAGNSERTCPGIGEEARDVLVKVFSKAKRRLLDLPVVKRTETGEPSLDKDAFDVYTTTLEGRQLEFVKAIKTIRKRSTSLGYLDSWEKFGLPCGPGWFNLFSSLNQTGTDTLRFSMSNPNLQQCSKQEDQCQPCEGKGCDACDGTGIERTSLRHVFGPAPGREWWSLDFENLELRIPAYEAGERALIDLFERATEPPYYGSVHLLNFHTVYRDVWDKELKAVGPEKVGKHCKEKYKSTLYQYDKNGWFCKQYGGQRELTDATFRRKGAYDLLDAKLAKLTWLNKKYIDFAEKNGYVETIPDKTVDPNRGYPVMTSRSEWGRISPTVPLNYHVQSSAMWCTAKSMVRCHEQLERWREDEGFDGRMILQVHDEICFDFPKGCHKDKAMVLKELMQESGTDIGVPLSVAATWNPQTWAKGQPF